LVLSVPHQNKIFCHTYRRRVYSRWQIALNLVVSSSDMTYETWLVYLQKSTIIYDIHHHLSPNGVCAFNVSRTTLHTLRERIHVLRKRLQHIPRFTRLRCAIVASRTTDTQPLPHDRDCPQASLILKGQVRDLHHPAGGTYLLTFSSVRRYKKINYRK
jgi:hypothetical protein